MPFDLDAFIANVNSDRSKGGSKKDRLNKVLMQTKDNQGINSFIPIISPGAKNIYLKLQKVYEYYGDTSLIDNGEAWYRILPFEYYGLTDQEDIELYNEVKGLLSELDSTEECDRNELRVRNYSLLFGINLNLKSSSKNSNIDDYKDCPCLFVYPSLGVIDALSTAINAKCDAMGGKKEWLSYIITPAKSGRQGIMQVSFIKSSGVGYDANISFELNSSFTQVVDPNMEISEETMKLFNDVLPTFLGWIYNDKDGTYFNKIAFTELKTQLTNRLKSIKEKWAQDEKSKEIKAPDQFENKNDQRLGQSAGGLTPPF